jgi:pimeloyl-ACP methyl ester carboxylesterase
MADDAQRVIKALNLPRFVLVGHSMGGKVAQLLASRHPTGLAGLVLVASSPPTPMNLTAEMKELMNDAYTSRETNVCGTNDWNSADRRLDLHAAYPPQKSR